MIFRFGAIFMLVLIALVLSEPTMYKKNEQNIYEPDLVPVSSTVIPEAEMPNRDEITAEMDLQYKKAYYSLFKKKFNAKLEKPDTLLTDKKKFNKNIEKNVTKKV
ncbi:CLUMA_CG014921, isoform A [Clunio marinus]|uniref:CLUMA_CG014921, isoform A n=1 Tax=Clunio marinus TaxID=568069 RepID=A0A1J1IT71_9DIPT|nr:CLUMA_CG014921, isoform A [Clunio marinus]